MTRGTRRLLWIAAAFLLVSVATRIGLGLFAHGAFTAGEWLRALSVGLVFDLTVLPWFLLPWAVYEAVMPGFAPDGRARRWEQRWAALWAALYLVLFAATAAAEFAFWGEFGSRFDFIAVDYLVYTHEVVGNIMESYPVAWWMSGLAGAAILVVLVTWPGGRRGLSGAGGERGGRLAGWARVGALAA
ncbi:MAG: hypothetical protein KDE22_19070, partial [Rhodobacterales bacterium]|nr:hypothetical protein [Rhodobacterales bacterium]